MAAVPTERINRRRTIAFTVLVSVSLVLMAISSNPYVREVQEGLGFAFRPIQGALDPLLLRAGGPALDRRIDELIAAWGQGPWVFNLGHGILPDTPIAHVEQTLNRIKG